MRAALVTQATRGGALATGATRRRGPRAPPPSSPTVRRHEDPNRDARAGRHPAAYPRSEGRRHTTGVVASPSKGAACGLPFRNDELFWGGDMTNVDVGHAGTAGPRWSGSAPRAGGSRPLTGCVVAGRLPGAAGRRQGTGGHHRGAITSITTTATSTAQWDRVDLACTWAVPDGSSPGDTFSLAAAAGAAVVRFHGLRPQGPDGQPVAHAHAGPDGSVVFTLTDYVLTHPVGVHGSCHFSTQYIAETTDETVHLDFQVGDEVIRVDVATVGPCTEDCAVDRTEPSKYMWWDGRRADRDPVGDPRPRHDLGRQRRDHHRHARPRSGPRLRLARSRPSARSSTPWATSPRHGTTPATCRVISCTTQSRHRHVVRRPGGGVHRAAGEGRRRRTPLGDLHQPGTVTVDGRSTPVHDQVRHQ